MKVMRDAAIPQQETSERLDDCEWVIGTPMGQSSKVRLTGPGEEEERVDGLLRKDRKGVVSLVLRTEGKEM